VVVALDSLQLTLLLADLVNVTGLDLLSRQELSLLFDCTTSVNLDVGSNLCVPKACLFLLKVPVFAENASCEVYV